MWWLGGCIIIKWYCLVTVKKHQTNPIIQKNFFSNANKIKAKKKKNPEALVFFFLVLFWSNLMRLIFVDDVKIDWNWFKMMKVGDGITTIQFRMILPDLIHSRSSATSCTNLCVNFSNQPTTHRPTAWPLPKSRISTDPAWILVSYSLFVFNLYALVLLNWYLDWYDCYSFELIDREESNHWLLISSLIYVANLKKEYDFNWTLWLFASRCDVSYILFKH